jgi:hypothetical protein
VVDFPGVIAARLVYGQAIGGVQSPVHRLKLLISLIITRGSGQMDSAVSTPFPLGRGLRCPCPWPRIRGGTFQNFAAASAFSAMLKKSANKARSSGASSCMIRCTMSRNSGSWRQPRARTRRTSHSCRLARRSARRASASARLAAASVRRALALETRRAFACPGLLVTRQPLPHARHLNRRPDNAAWPPQ